MRALNILPVLLLLNACIAWAAPPFTSNSGGESPHHHHSPRAGVSPRFRLPATITPATYELQIRPILEEEPGYVQFEAPGNVRINVTVDRNGGTIRNITLNSITIKINRTSIRVTDRSTETDVPIRDVYEDEERQFFTIEMENDLDKDAYSIYIEFVTVMPDGAVSAFGLYRTSYLTDDGQRRYLAVTDFESVDARRMVPCFDEPHLKAQWTISVDRKPAYHSLSNMPLDSSETLEDGWVRDKYPQSVKMSSYLVALCVSDYESSEADPTILPNVPVKVWGPPPMMAMGGGKYAPDFSAKVLKWFGDTLDEPYVDAMPKMDKLAIPDFSAGAMENWGLNTYRIVRLLYFEEESTIQEKVSMSDTLAHELAHQWFGDLVTMKWWDDLWLNEGFATYFSNQAASAADIHPEYGLNDYVIFDSVQYALAFDVGPTTHPLHYTGLETPAETRYGFDTISYDKGASILRMTHDFLSETLFYQGLRDYLNTFPYGNTDQENLFDTFQAVSGVAARLPQGVTVNDVLRTWTTQSGFPLIQVSRNDQNPVTITLSQVHYLSNATGEGTDQKWYVPVTYNSMAQPNKQFIWLSTDTNEASVTIPAENLNVGPDDYVVINPEQTGYYRVAYDERGLLLVRQQLLADPDPIDFKTRSALIDDYFNHAYNGYRTIDVAMDLSKYLTRERKLVPWASFVKNMGVPYNLLRNTGAYYYFRRFIRNLMGPALAVGPNAIGLDPVDGENVADGTLLRNRLFEWTCNAEHPACVQKSKDLLEAWMATPDVKPETLRKQPDLRPFVFCTAVANADDKQKVWDFVYQQYKESTRETDQLSLLRALACSKESFRLNWLIENALNNASDIRDAQRVPALQAVAGNTIGSSILFDHIRTHVNTIADAWGPSAVSSVVSTLSNYLSSEARLNDLEGFIAANSDKLSTVFASLTTSRDNVERNVKWLGTHYDRLRTWLEANYSLQS